MKYFFLISIFAIITGCTDSNNIQTSDFKDIVELKMNDGNPVDTTNLLGRGLYLYIVDDILIVHDASNPTKGIHFFKNNKYVKSVGTIGGAENEISRPGPIYLDTKKRFLWVSDFGRQTFVRHHIDSILSSDIEKSGHKFDFKKHASFEIQAIDDTTLLCMTMKPPFLYKIMSEYHNKDILNMKDINAMEAPWDLFMTTFCFDSEENVTYSAFRFFDMIMKVDMNGNILLKKKFFDGIGFDKSLASDRDRHIKTFSRIRIIGNRIFVLYNGLETFYGGDVGQPIPNFPDKILVFDLDLNPVKIIKFDGQLFDYNYNPDKKELYVYSESGLTHPLISYKIEI